MHARRFLIGILLTLITLSAIAMAFERPFPQNAKRGIIQFGMYPEIAIDGTTYMLPAGAHIWNRDNMIQQPSTLQGRKFVANYTVSFQGYIDRIWLLTKEEASKPLPIPQNNPPQ